MIIDSLKKILFILSVLITANAFSVDIKTTLPARISGLGVAGHGTFQLMEIKGSPIIAIHLHDNDVEHTKFIYKKKWNPEIFQVFYELIGKSIESYSDNGSWSKANYGQIKIIYDNDASLEKKISTDPALYQKIIGIELDDSPLGDDYALADLQNYKDLKMRIKILTLILYSIFTFGNLFAGIEETAPARISGLDAVHHGILQVLDIDNSLTIVIYMHTTNNSHTKFIYKKKWNPEIFQMFYDLISKSIASYSHNNSWSQSNYGQIKIIYDADKAKFVKKFSAEKTLNYAKIIGIELDDKPYGED